MTSTIDPNRRLFVADEEAVVAQSDDPESQFCYTPSLARAPNGNLILSYDLGGNIDHLHGYRPFPNSKQKMLCQIICFNENSNSSTPVRRFEICHARLFRLGQHLYLLGHNGRPQISRSDETGMVWSALSQLDDSDGWHSSACNVLITESRIYLCMERRCDNSYAGWNVAGLAPIVFSAAKDADLLDPHSWKKSSSFSFRDLAPDPRFDLFGMPFFPVGFRGPHLTHVSREWAVKSAPMGWLEGHVVQFNSRNHIWHDPNKKTLYVFLRCNSGGTGHCAVLKVLEDESNELYVDIAVAPSGVRTVFLPMPGGHNKFFIDYDKRSEVYWLVSTQPYNSARSLESLGPRQFGLPTNERHRLVLHYSPNCIDWIFAGVIAIGSKPEQSRNYPSFIFDGRDLLIVARSGNHDAKDTQYSNIITYHRVRDFRALVY